MEKICLKLLEELNSCSDRAERFYDWNDDLEKLSKSINEPAEAVRAAIRKLHESGHIQYLENQFGQVLYFSLDHNGLTYKEQRKNERKDFWREHFWVPLLVSFLAGITIDEAIRWLLKLIA